MDYGQGLERTAQCKIFCEKVIFPLNHKSEIINLKSNALPILRQC